MFLRRRLGDGKASRRWDLLGVVVLAPKHRGAGISWASALPSQKVIRRPHGSIWRRLGVCSHPLDDMTGEADAVPSAGRRGIGGIPTTAMATRGEEVRWTTRRGRRTSYRAREGGEQVGSPRRRWPREGRRSAPERKEEKERT
jgi:hypothetical protein